MIFKKIIIEKNNYINIFLFGGILILHVDVFDGKITCPEGAKVCHHILQKLWRKIRSNRITYQI